MSASGIPPDFSSSSSQTWLSIYQNVVQNKGYKVKRPSFNLKKLQIEWYCDPVVDFRKCILFSQKISFYLL